MRKKDEARRELGLDARPLIVSVWGSLGAERMNHVMTDFIALEAREDRHNLIHAIGSYGYQWVRDEIREKGRRPRGAPQHRCARLYLRRRARLCRGRRDSLPRGRRDAGEMAMMGKPVVIVPSPNVAENHQEKTPAPLNARAAPWLCWSATVRRDSI